MIDILEEKNLKIFNCNLKNIYAKKYDFVFF